MMKKSILEEGGLKEFLKEKKIESFRQKQILQEIYRNQNISFEEMTTLSKGLRSVLDEEFGVLSLKLKEKLEDEETTKFAFETSDGYLIESVLIYHKSKKVEDKMNRITLCISCQVGCPV